MLIRNSRLGLALLVLRLIKRLAPNEVSKPFLTCAKDLVIYKRHLAGVRHSKALVMNGKPLRLELGGGVKSTKHGWINVDLTAQDGLTLDLRLSLPFPDESVDSIYAEHFLEHFSYPDDLLGMLSEWYRVLRVGGTLTVGVPDAGRAFRAYAAGVGEFYFNKYWANVQPGFVNCPMDEINWLIYMGGLHFYMFDQENLMQRLEEAGFVDIKQREFDPTIDNPNRRRQTIYVCGKKCHSVAAGRDEIRKRQIRALIDEFASCDKVAAIMNKLDTADHYAVLRLAILIAGRWGDILAVGDRTIPVLSVLELFKPSTDVQAFGIIRTRTGQSIIARPTNNKIRKCHYPPIPFTEDRFTQVITIMNKQDLSAANSILADIRRVLTTAHDGRVYVVVPSDFNLEIPRLFACLHKEHLPADAGILFILKHAVAG